MIFADNETQLIQPGLTAPPLVVMSWCDEQSDAELTPWYEAGALVEKWLDNYEEICGANIAFDLLVWAANFPLLLPKIFALYDANKIYDVIIRQRLLDIAFGCYRGYLNSKHVWVPFQYGLDSIIKRHSDRRLNKDDAVRLTYGALRDVPLSQWPDTHILYSKEDALATRECFYGQEKSLAANPGIDLLADQHRQAKYDFVMKLASAWGLRTDEEAVKALEVKTLDRYERLRDELIQEGLVRAGKDIGKRDTKAAKARMLDVCGFADISIKPTKGRQTDFSFEPIPGREQKKMALTDSGDVSLSADACKDSEDPILISYGEYGEQKSVLSKDVKALYLGVYYPLHSNFGMAESGRRTSSNPNVQNWRRLPGIREAFRPRQGRVYVQADVEGLELCTLAQACYDLLGYSKLGDAINAGLDVHLDFGAAMLGISYEEAKRRKKLGDAPHVKILLAKETELARKPLRHEVYCTDAEWRDYLWYSEVIDARQAGKVANFGFPGGLGIKTMIYFAKATYNVILTEEQCTRLKAMWLAKWPEMNEYFAWINAQMVDGAADIKQLRSNRIRGNCTYCGASNTLFQGLGADATLSAGYQIAKECYLPLGTPLFGARIVNYIHDEYILEADDNDRAHDVAIRLERVMIDCIQPWVPNVRVAAPPLLMAYWSKNAKATYNDQGRLIPWC